MYFEQKWVFRNVLFIGEIQIILFLKCTRGGIVLEGQDKFFQLRLVKYLFSPVGSGAPCSNEPLDPFQVDIHLYLFLKPLLLDHDPHLTDLLLALFLGPRMLARLIYLRILLL